MAGHSFNSVYRALKRDELAPAYYLTGDETVLKDEVIALIVDRALDPASRDFNLDSRSAGDVNGESLHTLVETPPMLADRRVVIIKNLEQWRGNAKVWKVLDRYLEHPSPTTVLVLTLGAGQKVRSALAASTTHLALEPLPPDRLQRWITRRAKQGGFTLPADAADHLASAVGGDLAILAMEIDKLAAAAPADGVDVDLVADLVGVRRGETMPDWVDAVVLRDTVRAAAMLDAVLAASGATGVRMVNSLGTALIGVRLARAVLDTGRKERQARDAIFDALKQTRPVGLRRWGVEAEVWTRAAPRWTSGELTQALRTAYDCDRALKSTTVSDEVGTLAHMLLSMSTLEAAA